MIAAGRHQRRTTCIQAAAVRPPVHSHVKERGLTCEEVCPSYHQPPATAAAVQEQSVITQLPASSRLLLLHPLTITKRASWQAVPHTPTLLQPACILP
jgi:hypothetical protein